jgi:hypothetical protein
LISVINPEFANITPTNVPNRWVKINPIEATCTDTLAATNRKYLSQPNGIKLKHRVADGYTLGLKTSHSGHLKIKTGMKLRMSKSGMIGTCRQLKEIKKTFKEVKELK